MPSLFFCLVGFGVVLVNVICKLINKVFLQRIYPKYLHNLLSRKYLCCVHHVEGTQM